MSRNTGVSDSVRPLHRANLSLVRQKDDGASASESTLIRTKIQIPPDCGGMIHRERLERLEGEVQKRRLTLVVAPPGCGKTTLARQWGERLATQGVHVAWYSVDAEDKDPLRFMLYLHRAVELAGFPQLSSAKTTKPDAERVLFEMSSALINEAAETSEKLVIVIDNYSWVASTKIHDQVSYILNNAPANLHLVILATEQPPLPVGVLRARNQLLELNSSEISFTLQEMHEFLRSVGGSAIQPEQLREIHGYAQGWPAAVQIISQTIDKSEASSSSRRGVMDARVFDAIDEYIENLFASYPADLLDMMIDTSIVDSVSPSLWAALTAHGDVEGCFRQLRQRQILMPVDLDRGLFTYPAPVRSFLKKKLARKDSSHLSALHRHAYEWYAANEFWDLAIDHALARGDIDVALRWMELHAMSLLKAGYVSSVMKWHQQMPSFSASLPQKVYLVFAWAYAISRLPAPALALLAELDGRPSDSLPSDVQAECNAIRVVAYASGDQVDQANEWLEKCSGYNFSDPWISNLISSIRLYCRFRSGQWAEFFSEPMDLNAQGEGESNTHVLRLTILSMAALLRGQPEQAEQMANEALRLTPSVRKRDVLRFAAWPASVLVSIYYETGRFEDLRALLDDRMRDILSSGYLDCIMVTSLAAARCAAKEGKLSVALAVLDQAEATAIQHKWVRLEAAVVQERLRFYLNDNRRAEAEGCLLRLTQMPRGSEIGDSSTICTVAQTVAIAKAYLDISFGRFSDAIPSLEALLSQFTMSGNEIFSTRIGTLLSIAHAKAGHGEAADLIFRETIERAEKGGFVSAVVDQGPEVGELLSSFCAPQVGSKAMLRQRKFVERLLADWKSEFADIADESSATGSDVGVTGGTLSPKEREVLALMARGNSNKEIARSLGVTPETIKTHIKRMFAKLSVDRRAQAIDKAHALGLLSRETDAPR